MLRIMKNKNFFVAFVSCLLSCQSFGGKNITVKGNVTSKTDGQPIIGASVVQK